MPIFFAGLVAGALGGVLVSRGAEDISAVVKWVVIGGGAFLVAKAAKVI